MDGWTTDPPPHPHPKTPYAHRRSSHHHCRRQQQQQRPTPRPTPPPPPQRQHHHQPPSPPPARPSTRASAGSALGTPRGPSGAGAGPANWGCGSGAWRCSWRTGLFLGGVLYIEGPTVCLGVGRDTIALIYTQTHIQTNQSSACLAHVLDLSDLLGRVLAPTPPLAVDLSHLAVQRYVCGVG